MHKHAPIQPCDEDEVFFFFPSPRLTGVLEGMQSTSPQAQVGKGKCSLRCGQVSTVRDVVGISVAHKLQLALLVISVHHDNVTMSMHKDPHLSFGGRHC